RLRFLGQVARAGTLAQCCLAARQGNPGSPTPKGYFPRQTLPYFPNASEISGSRGEMIPGPPEGGAKGDPARNSHAPPRDALSLLRSSPPVVCPPEEEKGAM